MKLKFLSALSFLALLWACNSRSAVKPVVYDGTTQQAIIDNILTRRSIRKYTSQQVSQGQLDTIMKAAIFAPSAKNLQPWEVRVIQNPGILKEIDKRYIQYSACQGKKITDPNFSATFHAPTFIVIARDKKAEASVTTWLDCGIILENIMLAAHGINLGTCPMGSMVPFLNHESNADLLKLLNLPPDCEPAITCTLGYPDETPVVHERYPEKVKIIR